MDSRRAVGVAAQAPPDRTAIYMYVPTIYIILHTCHPCKLRAGRPAADHPGRSPIRQSPERPLHHCSTSPPGRRREGAADQSCRPHPRRCTRDSIKQSAGSADSRSRCIRTAREKKRNKEPTRELTATCASIIERENTASAVPPPLNRTEQRERPRRGGRYRRRLPSGLSEE